MDGGFLLSVFFVKITERRSCGFLEARSAAAFMQAGFRWTWPCPETWASALPIPSTALSMMMNLT